MKRLVSILVMAALAACNVATATKRSPTPAPRSTPSIASSRSTSTPSPTASPLNLLQKPPGNFTALSGTVSVDAGYIVSAGAGNIVSAGAGNIVSAGAGNIVSAGAGNIVSAGAGNIVSAGAGNIVAAGAGNIVAAGAGNIVAAGAGNLVTGKAFGLLGVESSPSPRVAAPGEVLPAAGMEVSVIDLNTDEPMPLGKDRNGQDVFTVYSNAEGRYTLYLPADHTDNVLVVARVPGVDDPRLNYDVATKPAESVVLDDDSALLTRFLRQTYASGLEKMMTVLLDPAATPGTVYDALPIMGEDNSSVRAIIVKELAEPINQVQKSIHARHLTKDDIPSEALVQADGLLAPLDLQSIEAYTLLPKTKLDQWRTDATAPKAWPIMLESIKLAREAVLKRLKTEVGPPYFSGNNAFKGVEIRKATDVMEFVLTQYFGDPKTFLGNGPENTVQAIGIDKAEYTKFLAYGRAGGDGVSHAIFANYFSTEAMTKLANKVKAKPKASPDPRVFRPTPGPTLKATQSATSAASP